MKTLLTINPHSFIDVITNSSTELFVCDTDKTAEMVDEMLQSFNPPVGEYAKPWVFDIQEYREFKKQENEIRKNWKTGDQWQEGDRYPDNKYSQVSGWFYDLENEEDLEYLRKQYIEEGDRSSHCYRSWDNGIYGDRLASAQTNSKDLRTSWDARKAEVNVIYSEIKALDEKPDWWINPIKYSGYEKDIASLDGKVMLFSESDNSMDYDCFGHIERLFNATRYHLG